MGLLGKDGGLRTRVPARATDDRSAIGGTPNFTALLHRAENPQAEPIRITSTFDGKVRLVSANSVRGYPTLIATSITEHAALAGWRRQAIGIAIAAAAAALAFAALFVTLVRQVRRLEESQTALARNNTELLGTPQRLEAQPAALVHLVEPLTTNQT